MWSISQRNKIAKKPQQGRNENIFKLEDEDSRSTYFSENWKNIVLSLESDRWINLGRLSAFSSISSFLLFMKIALPLFSHRSLYCVQYRKRRTAFSSSYIGGMHSRNITRVSCGNSIKWSQYIPWGITVIIMPMIGFARLWILQLYSSKYFAKNIARMLVSQRSIFWTVGG